jgi:hypothetical protein
MKMNKNERKRGKPMTKPKESNSKSNTEVKPEEPVSSPKEIYKYITDNNSKLFSFNIDGEKIIVKRYNLTLDEEKTFY